MTRIISVLFTIISLHSFAQMDVRFSQFNVAKALLNPAATGVEAKFSADLIYRSQWSNQPGTPASVGFVTGYELNNSHAIGLSAINDRVGIAKGTAISAAYAYRIHFNDEQFLAFGASAGVENVNNDYSRLFLINQNDPAFLQSFNQWRFNAGFGMYYNGPKMYLGYSIPFLMTNIHTGPNNGIKPNMWHHYLVAGFYMSNQDETYKFNPLIQVKYVPNAPIQADLILRNIFYGTFAFSVGYRSENAISAGFDIMISNVARLGYNFNYNLGRYAGFRATSHEVYLGMGIPYYYETNPFSKRKYISKRKPTYSKEYERRAKKYNKR